MKAFMTRGELAERWGRCPRTIRRLELAPPPGFPPPVRIGARWLFAIAAVEAFERSLASNAPRLAA